VDSAALAELVDAAYVHIRARLRTSAVVRADVRKAR
jgi:hypothetical protein